MVNFSPHTGSQQSPKKLSARASVLWFEDKISTSSKYGKNFLEMAKMGKLKKAL